MEREPQKEHHQDDAKEEKDQRNGSIFAWLLASLRHEEHQEEPEKTPVKAEKEDERNGHIFAWLLARARQERQPDAYDTADEPTPEEAERVIEEAEEAIADAEDAVELRHIKEAEAEAEVDYEAELEKAEVARDESRAIVATEAREAADYFDPSPSVESKTAMPVAGPDVKAVPAAAVTLISVDSIFGYYRDQKHKRLEKKLKKEVTRHKKQLKKLELKVNKVQETKIQKLVGRITDLENDNHKNHFEPRHIEVPRNVVKEKVTTREKIVRAVAPLAKKEAAPEKKEVSVKSHPKSVSEPKKSERPEIVVPVEAKELHDERLEVREKDHDDERKEHDEQIVMATQATVVEETVIVHDSPDQKPARAEKASVPDLLKNKQPAYWTVVGLLGVLIAAAITQL